MQPNEDNDDLDALDRLIDRELRLLCVRYRPKQAPANRAAPAAPKAARQDAREEVAASQPDNVVRAHPLARRPRRQSEDHFEGLFSRDEEAFLANAADWLENRPNADILLDALSRRVMGDVEDADPRPATEDDWEIEDDDESDDEGWGDDPELAPPGVDATETGHFPEVDDEPPAGATPDEEGDDPVG